MRYAIVSDIHANMQAWEAVLADARAQGAEAVICLGDVVGYGPRPAEVLASVRAVTNNFVMGNHDAAAVGMMDYSIFNDHARQAIEWTMAELNGEAKKFLSGVPLAIEAGEILFVHAEIAEPGRFDYIDSVEMAKENFAVKDQLVTFVGHTHLPKVFERSERGRVKELPDTNIQLDPRKRYIVNVGSVGEPRNPEDLRARYLIYDDQSRVLDFRRVEFDIPAYRRDLESTTLALRPYFLRVYEQVVEGREVVVSQGGSLVDMKVDHNSAALVDMGRVSNVAQYSNSGAMLESARESKAPSVVLGVMVALVLVGGLIVWATQSGDDADDGGKTSVVQVEVAEKKRPKTIPVVPEVAVADKEPSIRGQENKDAGKPAVMAAKAGVKPKPKVPQSAPPEPKPAPEPVKVESGSEVAWWRMDGDSEEGILTDVGGRIHLYPLQKGKKMDPIAPDPIPLNQEENKSALQVGVWQEDVASEFFKLSSTHSFTLEGWFLSDVSRQPIFLLGTRTGGSEDNRGWHLDLRPPSLGQRDGKMSFFYDSGSKITQALATEVSVLDLRPHHFAVVWDHDAGKSSGRMHLYLNGEQVAEKPLPYSRLLANQANPFRIGAESNPEKLALDELRFTRRALAPHDFLVRTRIQGATITKAGPKNKDSWGVPSNWEGGKLPGKSDNVVIEHGLTVQVEKKRPEPYEGSLVLCDKAKLLLWNTGSLTALPKGPGKLVMYEGSRVVLRTGHAEFGPIELMASAEIRGGESTQGHNTKRRFTGELSGPGKLTLNGVNKNAFYFDVPNSYSGGTRAYSRQKQGYRISVKTNDAFGTGDVTVEEHVSLKLGKGLGDAIDDGATLTLVGKEGSEAPKLRLESSETVAAFVIDGEDQGTGVFSKETHPQIGGNGKLTVTGKGR